MRVLLLVSCVLCANGLGLKEARKKKGQWHRPGGLRVGAVGPGDNSGRFQNEKQLGKGAFGTVYLVKDTSNNMRYALKKQDPTGQELTMYNTELTILKNFCKNRHPYVMRFKDEVTCPSWTNPTWNSKCLILGLAAGGEMGKKGKSASSSQIYKWLVQSLAGLSYMHYAGYVHRDIKGANIFLDYKDRVLIGDVGLTGRKESDQKLSGQMGTPYFMAPEIWRNERYTEKVDIFALGVTFFELCTGMMPFSGATMPALMNAITNRSPPRYAFSRCSGWKGVGAEKTILSMLSKDISSIHGGDYRHYAHTYLTDYLGYAKTGTPPGADAVACDYLKRRCPGEEDFGGSMATVVINGGGPPGGQGSGGLVAPPRKIPASPPRTKVAVAPSPERVERLPNRLPTLRMNAQGLYCDENWVPLPNQPAHVRQAPTRPAPPPPAHNPWAAEGLPAPIGRAPGRWVFLEETQEWQQVSDPEGEKPIVKRQETEEDPVLDGGEYTEEQVEKIKADAEKNWTQEGEEETDPMMQTSVFGFGDLPKPE